MKRMRKSLRGNFWKRVISYVLMVCLIMNTSVPTLLALGPGDVDSSSGATFPVGPWGAHPTIDADHGAIINWNNFNTSTGESVTFNQPSALSAVLNRIDSGAITQFNGALNANGRVFVVNPAGVIFGNGSTVNVAQLVVSGLSMNLDIDPLKDESEEFLDIANGADMHFTGGSGVIENRKGAINADSVFLVGKKILNIGSISAPNGLIVIAAGEEVFIAQDGSSVLVNVSEFFYDVADTDPDIENRSGIAANGTSGKIILAAGDVFSRAISNPGGLTARQGSISAYAAKVESHGRLSVAAATPGGGGTIHLTGTESVELAEGTVAPPLGSWTTADAALHGPGGSITLESTNAEGTGTVTIADGHFVTARGGTDDGDGGNVKITADHIVVAGDIDASPHNPDFENGTLTIDPPTVTVANGANAGAMDTIYEEDIEALSQGDPSGGATNLVVHADDSITVQNILDDLIEGGRGDIEFHAPTIHFEDTVATDTLSTTTGDIVMVGGAGGINTGHLQTGAASLAGEAGAIDLSTTDGGDITTRDLTVRGGQTEGSISAVADGALEVGTVHVGADTPIDNGGSGGAALAQVYLESGDDMMLNGPVTAEAETADSGNPTATVRIFAGVNGATSGLGDATINDDLLARAESTGGGTSYALVEVDTYGEIEWIGDADATAIGDNAQVLGVRETQDDTDGADEAHVIINEQGNLPDVTGMPDDAATHMGDAVGGNVLDNDIESEGADLDVASHTDPAHGTLEIDLETGEFTYTPDEGYVGDDTFTYTATNDDVTTGPITVTVSVTNDPPGPVDDAANTHMNQAVGGNVLTNDTDANGDPLSVALNGTDPAHGTVELNEDGTFTYTPDEGYVGDDTFTYNVTDGQLDAGSNPVVETGTVTVTVGNAPPAPVDDAAATFASTEVAGNVLANDIDPDGDPLTVVLDGTPPTNGTVVLNPDGSFTYTPDPGFTGEDTFTYEVTDGEAGSGPVVATVTITVNPFPVAAMSPVAPGLERRKIEYSGCPALAKWVAKELGITAAQMNIWMSNTLASSRDIQPYETLAKLRTAAVILKDISGTHIAALTQVVNEFASSTAPPTEEQMASIADAIASNAGADNHYGIAEEYLNALAQYISILNTDLGFSMNEAVQFATANYVNQLGDRGNANVAAYVSARLAEL